MGRVFFADLRTSVKRNLFDKIDELLNRVGIGEMFKKGQLVAVKLHFGEKGNTSFINPIFAARVVDGISSAGALPFLTDTNTLYIGTRANAVSHLKTAVENGFGYSTVNAPVIIADGLRGDDGEYVEVNGRHLKEVKIARAISEAHGLVALTHFKCHEMTGIGGALKNIGMGCAAREGKLTQHSKCAPLVDPGACTACGVCALNCPADAIDVGAVAVISDRSCIGCGYCIAVCPEAAIKIQWNESTINLQEKMAEHAYGALKGKKGKCAFLSFVMHVSPECDCYGHSDAAIVPDVGILASTDPVAIDQAAADLVNARQGVPGTALGPDGDAARPGSDKFKLLHPDVDWTVQLKYAEELGLGSRRYELKEVL